MDPAFFMIEMTNTYGPYFSGLPEAPSEERPRPPDEESFLPPPSATSINSEVKPLPSCPTLWQLFKDSCFKPSATGRH